MVEELMFSINTGKIVASLIIGMGALEFIICIIEKLLNRGNTFYMSEAIITQIKGAMLWTAIFILEKLLQTLEIL